MNELNEFQRDTAVRPIGDNRYRVKLSDRWWMEVPVETDLMTKYERHYMVPCSLATNVIHNP